MKNTYIDLIEEAHRFPQEGFDLNKSESLMFHGVSLKCLIEEYGTPFKLIYLPKIGSQIKKARNLFQLAIKEHNYKGKYRYCYCTKCNHFSPVLRETLDYNVDLETSSFSDIDILLKLYHDGKIEKTQTILHNGYKTATYLQKILELNKAGFTNSVIILDSVNELKRIQEFTAVKGIKIGIRMAINENEGMEYSISRFGIPSQRILDFFHSEIKNSHQFELTMVHFFVSSGIKDSPYYWQEFKRALDVYIALKKEAPSLTAFNIGGGFPVQNRLNFKYDYKDIINKIVGEIKEGCSTAEVSEPDIFTEFGKYTVGESSAIIFEVLEQKQQSNKEAWYIINNSLMNTIPDALLNREKFILLPINKWKNEYQAVTIGGISCDQADYYNKEASGQKIVLPQYSSKSKEPLYLGFFHTGAYQDAISGYGGIKHCLIPVPKQVIIDRDEKGNFVHYVYEKGDQQEQKQRRVEKDVKEMFDILGYH